MDAEQPEINNLTGRALQVSLEASDTGLFNHINKNVNAYSTTNKGFEKVPVIFSSFERAFVTKEFEGLRDDDGTIIFPVISVKRTGLVKDMSSKSSFWADAYSAPGPQKGNISTIRRVNAEKTRNFTNADNKKKNSNGLNFKVARKKSPKTVYDVIYVPQVSYITVEYEVKIKTHYMQQMNEIVQCFLSDAGNQHYFIVKHEGHRFEAFYNQDLNENNSLDDSTGQERIFETSFTIRVIAYILGKGKQNETPARSIHQTVANVSFGSEFVDEIED